MPDQERLFVGREQELAALKQAIARPKGQLILVVGGVGIGKTALLEELNAHLADNERYFGLLYRLNRNDTSEVFLSRLTGDLLNISGLTEFRLVLNAPRQVERWKTLAKLIPVVGSTISDLGPQERRPIREQFAEFLHAAAGKLKDSQRLVLIFDPDEYLDESVETDWVSLTRDLPAQTTIVFAQRPDDYLARSAGLRRAANVFRIPDGLTHLSREESDDLVATRWEEHSAWKQLRDAARRALQEELWSKYEGYALPLTMALRDLPKEPASVEELLEASRALPRDYAALLRDRYDDAVETGEDATRVLHALAILEVPATCERLAPLYTDQSCDPATLVSACRRDEVARCLSFREGGVVGFFHATMGECILDQMSDEATQDLHRRAAALYQTDLDTNASDKEALDRLPYHTYHAGDVEAFLAAVDRVGKGKHRLRLLRSYERDLRRALPLCRKLAESQPAAFEPYLAGMLHNLATVLRDLGEWAGVRQAFEQALAIRRRLADAQPGAFEPHLAVTLNNLGNTLADQGEHPRARETLEEALAISRKLANACPVAFQPYVAGTLNSLANLLREMGHPGEARRALREALAVYRKLCNTDPATFEPDLAMTLSNLGNVLHTLGKAAQAREVHEEALAIRRKLAQAEPAAFLPDLAATLNNLGLVLCDLGEAARARQAYEEALAIARRLAKAEPAAFEPHIAGTLSNLGDLLSDLGERAQARAAYDETLSIYTRYAKAEPKAFAGHLATVVHNALKLLEQPGEKPEEWPALVEAQKLLAQLSPPDQDDKQDDS